LRNPDTETEGADKDVDLEVGADFEGSLKVACNSAASEIEIMEKFIESFKVKYPKITVTPTYLQSSVYAGNVQNKARAATQMGKYEEMYDVFWMSQDKLVGYYASDLLANLSGLGEADTKFNFSDLVDFSVADGTIQEKVYMMPRDYNQVVMYYNRDIFDAVDMAYPINGMTGQAFTDMLTELNTKVRASTAKNEYGLFYRDMPFLVDLNVVWDAFSWPLVKSFGGRVVDEAGTVVFNSDETFNAINYWKNLVDKGYAITVGQGKSSGSAQFMMQNSAIFFHARAVMSNIILEDPSKELKGVQNLGVAAIPNFGGTYAIGAGSSGYCMYKHSVNATAAWLFLKHIVSVEGQDAFSQTGNCVPVRKEMLTDTGARWRTWGREKFGQDFNNNAFIYNMDTAATTPREYYPYVPIDAQTAMLSGIDTAFANAISRTNPADMKKQIADSAERMTTAINQAR
jgi:multiple sugar transport system substrate-binding protein